MPREKKAVFTVQVVGGVDGRDRSSIVYSGASEQFARHDLNTARTAAQLASGTALVILRKNGEILYRVNVYGGQVLQSELDATKGGR
jgi:hypothetical protein